MNQHPPHFLLTIDVEDWFQVENFKSVIPFSAWDNLDLRVERNVNKLLDLFDEFGTNSTNTTNPTNTTNKTNATNATDATNKPKIQCTFFVLGWVAKRLPGLVREISNRGHEVASHGFDHDLCNKITETALKKDLIKSKSLLEDITGEEILGYRAPSFSVNGEILKQIQEAGYRYDSSYNSFDRHGRYGKLSIDGLKRSGLAFHVSDSFHEIPVSNLSVLHQEIPWGGGGYFRLLPNVLFKRGVRSILKKRNGYVFYIHPWEVDPEQPWVHEAPRSFKFRHYLNLHKTEFKLNEMIEQFRDSRFISCSRYLATLKNGRSGHRR